MLWVKYDAPESSDESTLDIAAALKNIELINDLETFYIIIKNSFFTFFSTHIFTHGSSYWAEGWAFQPNQQAKTENQLESKQ